MAQTTHVNNRIVCRFAKNYHLQFTSYRCLLAICGVYGMIFNPEMDSTKRKICQIALSSVSHSHSVLVNVKIAPKITHCQLFSI